jgi:hypothetical protein
VGSRWASLSGEMAGFKSLATPPSFPGQTAMRRESQSLEECLKEAAEYERLAPLARLQSTRRMLELSARYWRNRAVRATERERTYLH